ncbi:metallophosphoesterase [Shouchella patagoniensis]|uniref:metallophosphoesterase n=1 Tax=Shouchella patagoniensis TaxID=228576 RepID=UPI001FEAC6F1|nr:metallophosphoesterase [Shouchella patagoniensis]
MFTRKTIIISTAFFAAAIVFFYAQNNWLVQTSYTVESANIPPEFNDFTIIQLSDLHSKEFGESNHRLLSSVQAKEPDAVFVTGDLIDSYTPNNGEGVFLMEQLVNIAPVYYVTGNHEWRLGIVEELQEKLESIGVEVLRNQATTIFKDDAAIELIGIDDPDSNQDYAPVEFTTAALNTVQFDKEQYQILLSHRPETFSAYKEAKIDLVFTGHAHGGQIRLPLIGGILSPGQGLFPEFSEGLHDAEYTTMIVSRGLGNSLFPLRLFNRPEVIELTLKSI